MEIVLQWLDDLDDLMSAAALRWETLRLACLRMGLLAAAVLAAGMPWAVSAAWAPALTVLAVVSVLVWTADLAVCLLLARARASPDPA